MSRTVDLTANSDSDSTVSYEVLSDSDGDEPHSAKRKHGTPKQEKRSKVSSKTAVEPSSEQSKYADLGYRLTTVAGINKSFNDPSIAISLKGVLEGSPKFGSLTNSVQFNYMFDIDWLIDQYPSDAQTSPILIVHGFRGSDEAGLRMTASPYPQVSLAQARLESPYGTHHTKMMLLEYEKGVRVVVHTANMIHEDWHQKSQMVWLSPLLPRLEKSGDEKQKSEFLSALSNYLTAYNLPALKNWIDKLHKFDFSLIRDDEVTFVASVPGRHSGSSLHSFGHMRLRSCLQKHKVKLPESPSDASPSSPPVRVIAQFSSIGSLGESADKWVVSELVASCLSYFSSHETLLKAAAKPRPILIYPPVADVRGSLEGYAAGGSLPYRREVANKQKWLNSLLHCWRANGVGRTRAMPHVKTFSVVSSDFSKVYWLLITSANLSKAAWGKLEKNDSQLGILSYEAGVLLTPKKSSDAKLYWPSSRLLLPFDLPPQPYSRNDEPWIADIPQSQRDSRGLTWLI